MGWLTRTKYIFRFAELGTRGLLKLRWIVAYTYEDALMQALIRGWNPIQPHVLDKKVADVLIQTNHPQIDLWFLPED